MAPTVSQLASEGLITPTSATQLESFKAGVMFARTVGIIPAPESNHAIAQVIKEAIKAKESGAKTVILFNLSGHGLLDLGSYEKYFSNQLPDYVLEDSVLKDSEKIFEAFPKPNLLKSV
jgi:tryptophan synthase beta chain